MDNNYYKKKNKCYNNKDKRKQMRQRHFNIRLEKEGLLGKDAYYDKENDTLKITKEFWNNSKQLYYKYKKILPVTDNFLFLWQGKRVSKVLVFGRKSRVLLPGSVNFDEVKENFNI